MGTRKRATGGRRLSAICGDRNSKKPPGYWFREYRGSRNSRRRVAQFCFSQAVSGNVGGEAWSLRTPGRQRVCGVGATGRPCNRNFVREVARKSAAGREMAPTLISRNRDGSQARQAAHERRGAAHCDEHGQAAGAMVCSVAMQRVALRSPPPHSGYFCSTPSTLTLRA